MPPPGRESSSRPLTPFEVIWGIGVCVAGLVLRVWHLGTPSLWWDEIVHVATSWKPDAWSVFQQAKLGMPPGFGNAGAMPIDYLVLHAYLQRVPMPRADDLEVYFRAPSCAFSALTLPLLWLWARRSFGRGVALVAATMLAFSLPHVLYAAEARAFSLCACLTVVQLAAFAWLAEAPSVRRWTAFGVVSVVYVLTGLMGLLVVTIMYGVLAGDLILRGVRRQGHGMTLRRDAAMFAWVVSMMAGSLYAYFLGTHLWVTASHKIVATDPFGTTVQTLSYYVWDSPLLLAVLVLSVPVLLLACWRSPERYRPVLIVPVVLVLVGVIPGIVELERRKRYYFHVRHALFLLPVVYVAVALTFDAVFRWLASWRAVAMRPGWRRAVIVAVPLAVVLAISLPHVADYVTRPYMFFRSSKTLRDFKALSRTLRASTSTFLPGEKLLVLSEHFGQGYLANTVLTLYLRWYGLEDRIVLRGVAFPGSALRSLAALCPEGCRGQDGPTLERQLSATGALAVPLEARWLLRIGRPLGAWPGRLRSVIVVTYASVPPGPWAASLDRRSYYGLTTWQPRADIRAPS